MNNQQLAHFCADPKNANLKILYLFNTQVTDISPLVGLENLERLHLYSTQVSDISPLAGLTNLINLNLDSTQVSDINALAALVNLQCLNLSDTQVSDISALAGLVKLERLYLDDCPIPYAVHDAGKHRRTIVFRKQNGLIVANLGCRFGTFASLQEAIRWKYKNVDDAEDYINKLAEAYDKYLVHFKIK